jgi:DNA-binding transcriptional ArsR family regulator
MLTAAVKRANDDTRSTRVVPPIFQRCGSTSSVFFVADDTDLAARNRLEVRDPKIMRALAHPARLAIIDHLVTGKSATATELADVCGLSPSATSYHLRELAKHGLISEAPSRGDGRERVWQVPYTGIELDSGPAVWDTYEAEAALLDAVLLREQVRVRSWLERSRSEPKEWYDAAAVTDGTIVVTAAELKEFNDTVAKLISKYRRSTRPQPPEGARRVSVVFQAFPVD